MKLLSFVVIIVVLVVVGCAKKPQLEGMRQLDKKEVMEVLAQKTLTYPTSYGRWAAYYVDHHLNGSGKAWGRWGKEIARLNTTISDDGELCQTYKGNKNWSSTNDPVCFKIYIDSMGIYYSEITVDSVKPERVGTVRSLQIFDGNFYAIQ
jgi:hypothetical protein